MSVNIESSKISLFPVAKPRTNANRSNRLFYEDNITNLIRQVVDKEGFIINFPTDLTIVDGSKLKSISGSHFIFNIYGYYIDIDMSDGIDISSLLSLDTNPKTIYGAIILQNNIEVTTTVSQDSGDDETTSTTKSVSIPLELANQDEHGVYKSFYLSDSNPNNTNDKYLELFSISNDNNVYSITPCKESLQKFKINSFIIDGIDGKR